jgi:RNA recognition motif. (a.k.a. RRM, RBD, or RNP domain)
VEVNLPIDKFTKKIMGFAIVKFTPAENAVKAYAELDGTAFQVIKMLANVLEFIVCSFCYLNI